MLNSNEISPLYEQLTEQIRADIEQGVYAPGEKIPTEMNLCKKYNVSRATVRNALAQLETSGLIVRKQGKGTFIRENKLVRNISINSSFSDICIANGKRPGGKVLRCMFQKASPDDISELKLKEGDLVVALDRIRYADDIPVSFEFSHMPEKFSFLLDEDMTNKSLIQVLRDKNGIIFYPGHKTIEQSYATREIAKYLNVHTGTPLISISAVSNDEAGDPIHRSVQYILGDKIKLYL